MHKSSVRFRFGFGSVSVRQKKSEVRFGSASAKNSCFGRFLIYTIQLPEDTQNHL